MAKKSHWVPLFIFTTLFSFQAGAITITNIHLNQKKGTQNILCKKTKTSNLVATQSESKIYLPMNSPLQSFDKLIERVKSDLGLSHHSQITKEQQRTLYQKAFDLLEEGSCAYLGERKKISQSSTSLCLEANINPGQDESQSSQKQFFKVHLQRHFQTEKNCYLITQIGLSLSEKHHQGLF